MGKYEALEKDVFAIFGTPEWEAEGIATYPSDFTAATGDEFIRVSIIPSGRGLNPVSASGQIIIEIYIAAGNGPSRASKIADFLDRYLVGASKVISGKCTQLFDSSMAPAGKDRDNPALSRYNYTIPFKHFGVR
jgi:hypothetical protein